MRKPQIMVGYIFLKFKEISQKYHFERKFEWKDCPHDTNDIHNKMCSIFFNREKTLSHFFLYSTRHQHFKSQTIELNYLQK